MGNEVIWYIIIGIIYLIFGTRRKKKKRPNPGAMEQVFRELTQTAADQVPHFETPVMQPAPSPAAALQPRPQIADVRITQPLPDVMRTTAPAAKTKTLDPSLEAATATSDVLEKLRNPSDARTAVILSTLLGPPHALRGQHIHRAA